MIEFSKGNLLEAPVQALVNTVNTEGIMGKGIALQFKQAFPDMYNTYDKACKAREVKLGKVHIYDLGGLVGGPRWIINFPTKGHWKSKSKISDIQAGLTDLTTQIKRLGITSIAIPPLGCGHGGLDWNEVRPLILHAFEQLPDTKALIYSPEGAPAANQMPNRTTRPDLTKGRAALLGLMKNYLNGLLDPFISLLEIHKLVYFMQEAGEDLRLEFEAHHFGPYALNLRHVLIKLEGHFLHGYGDGEDTPSKPIEIDHSTIALADAYLESHPDILERMNRVTDLIAGFENPYGMELLSSMHWVMCNTPGARDSLSIAIQAVQKWNDRKRETLKPEHLQKAWDHLKSKKWDTESRSGALVKPQ